MGCKTKEPGQQQSIRLVPQSLENGFLSLRIFDPMVVDSLIPATSGKETAYISLFVGSASTQK